MTESNYEECIRFPVQFENGTARDPRYNMKRYDVNPIHGRRRSGSRLWDFDIPKPCVLVLFILLLISLLLLGLLPLILTPDCPDKKIEEKQEFSHLNGAGFVPLSGTQEYLEVTTNTMDDLTSTEATIQSTIATPKYDYRLPENLSPQTYTVKLLVFPENATTDGYVHIHFTCLAETDKVVLNFKNMLISFKSIHIEESQSATNLTVTDTSYDKEEEKLIITVDQMLKKNANYDFTAIFRGQINDIPKGVYRTSYIDPTFGGKTWMVSTLFSPTEARSAFPCFDEPIYKARFNFIIGRPARFISLSNMKIKMSEPIQNGYVLDYYDETPTMSTYLTAFTVGRFKEHHLTRENNMVEINSYTRTGGQEHMKYALELAPRIVRFYEDYFKLKFPLPKIDLIAVPNQMYSAMENWGAIIFKEDKIFINDNSTDGKRQSVALILAHELAHQWFGNLVTPKWWSDLWLKEGFSTYFAYMAVDYVSPEWDIFNRFSTEEMDVALLADSLNSTEVITKDVKKPNNELFSVIQYHKGTSIIWMMSNLLGELTSKMWVSKYLMEYSFKNADQNDLWNSITEESHKMLSLPSNYSIKTIMDSWTTQLGYPIVTITRTQNGEIHMQQQRFLPFSQNDDNESLWWIPVSFAGIDSEKVKNVWLLEKKATYTTENLAPGENYLANIDKAGFYRVNYDHENWVGLIKHFENLNPATKGQLLVDSFALAEYGILKYDIALSMALQLTREANKFVWRSVKNPLYYIHNSLILTPAFGDYQIFVRALLPIVYYSVNPNNSMIWINKQAILQDEDHITNILDIACKFEYDICVTNSIHLFNIFKSSNGIDPMSISLRPIVYCTAIKHLGREEWEFIYDLRTNPETGKYLTQDEAAILVHSLGCASKPWLLTRALVLILAPNSVLTKEEGVLLFKSVAENPVGLRIALSYLKNMLPRLIQHYKEPAILYEMIQSMIPFLNTPDDIGELKVIMKNIANMTNNENELLQRQCLEKVENNMNWMKKNILPVANFLGTFRKEYNL